MTKVFERCAREFGIGEEVAIFGERMNHSSSQDATGLPKAPREAGIPAEKEVEQAQKADKLISAVHRNPIAH